MKENFQYVRANADRIPADIRDKVLAAIEHAEETGKWNRVPVNGWSKESEKHIAEIVFLKAEIKGLVAAIHGRRARNRFPKQPTLVWKGFETGRTRKSKGDWLWNWRLAWILTVGLRDSEPAVDTLQCGPRF